MVKESTIALGLAALGVAFTGVIAWTLTKQTTPTPGAFQTRQAPQSPFRPPENATQSEQTHFAQDRGIVARRRAALFGGVQGRTSGSPDASQSLPRAAYDYTGQTPTGTYLQGGVTGYGDTASGGEQQFQGPFDQPGVTGTRYGSSFLGLEIGGYYHFKPRNLPPEGVPIY